MKPRLPAFPCFHLLAAIAVSALLPASGSGAAITQTAATSSGQSWATASIWSNTAAASAGNTYSSNGYNLRTPDSPSGSTTFAGDSLTLEGGTGGARSTLSLKAGTTTIANLLMGVSTVSNAVNNGSSNVPATLNVTNLTVLSAATSAAAATLQGSNTGNNLTLSIANLLGDGFLQFTTSRTFALSVTDGSAFTGTLNLNQGSLTLATDLGLGGAFSMATSSASLVLANDLSVASFTFGATQLAAGSYSSSELNTLFATSAFSGSGTVSVSAIPEPSTCALLLGGLAVAAVAARRWRSR